MPKPIKNPHRKLYFKLKFTNLLKVLSFAVILLLAVILFLNLIYYFNPAPLNALRNFFEKRTEADPNVITPLADHDYSKLYAELDKTRENTCFETHTFTFLTFDPVLKNPEKACAILISKNSELQALSTLSARLKNLKILEIKNTTLTSLPSQIKHLKNLRRLEIHDTRNLTLPPEIGELKKLFILKIINAHLKHLPPEVGNLSSLNELIISGNKDFIYLPPEIGNASEILSLNLENNSLQSLPETLAGSQIFELYLNRNSFSEFPSVIPEMPEIVFLNLSDNKIKTVPESLSKMAMLHDLEFKNNSLISFPSLTNLKKLRNIDLEGNNLEKLSDFPLNGLLTRVDLSHNALTGLPPTLFEASKLTYLDLSYNKLTEIASIASKTNKIAINITGNNLTKVPFFPNFKNYVLTDAYWPTPTSVF